MGKILLNPYRNAGSINGLVELHQSYLDQPVRTGSDVTFKSLLLSNDLTVNGNMTVSGQVTTINTTNVLIEDEIIQINAGNNLINEAGIQVDRGPSATPYLFLYDEASQAFKIGMRGYLQEVATREDVPTNNYLAVWNSSLNRFDSRNIIDVPLTVENALQGQTIVVGLNFTSSMSVNSQNDLVISSNHDVLLTPGSSHVKVASGSFLDLGSSTLSGDSLGNLSLSIASMLIPTLAYLYFGSTNNSIYATSGGRLQIKSMNGIDVHAGGSMTMDVNIPIVFGTYSQIYGANDLSLNLVATGDVNIVPGAGTVKIPSETSVRLGGAGQLITGHSNNDISIVASGNISLTPGAALIFPVNTRLTFGPSTQTIDSSSTNVNIRSQGQINLTAGTSVNVPVMVPLSLGSYSSVYEDSSNGGLVLKNTTYDIRFLPGPSRSIYIPENVALMFGTSESVQSNGGDLQLSAAGNISLYPGSKSVVIPVGSNVAFGSAGQKISGDAGNNLVIVAGSADILLDASGTVNVTKHILFGTTTTQGGTFTASGGSIYDDGSSNVVITANHLLNLQAPSGVSVSSTLSLLSTTDSLSATSGSFTTPGGLAAAKTIVSGKGFNVISTNGFVNLKTDNAQSTIVSMNCSGIPLSIMNASSVDGSSMQLLATYDTNPNFVIGRGPSSGRTMVFQIADYADYSSVGSLPAFVFQAVSGGSLLTIRSDKTATFAGPVCTSSTSSASISSSGGVTCVGLVSSGDISVVSPSNTSSSLVSVTSSAGGTFAAATGQFILKRTDGSSMFTATGASNSIAINAATTLNAAVVVNNTNTQALTINGSAQFAGNVSVSGGGILDVSASRITSVGSPTASTDAANKAYVDAISPGLKTYQMVKAATVGTNLDLTAILSHLDGVGLSNGDRVLVKDQTDPTQNGVYVVSDTTAPSRASDMAISVNVSSAFVFVSSGSVNVNAGFVCISSPAVIGTNSITWTQFSYGGQLTAGSALTMTGTTLDVSVDGVSIEVSNDQLRLKSTGIGTGLSGGSGTTLTTSTDQSHVTKLGTITTGVWSASPVSVASGGTGLTSVATGCVPFGNNASQLTTSSNFVFSNQYLGVGTSAPQSDVHVSSASSTYVCVESTSPTAVQMGLKLKQSVSETATISLTNANALYIGHDGQTTASVINFATRSLTRMTVIDSGYVGINTTSPSTELHVGGTITTNNIIVGSQLNLGSAAFSYSGSTLQLTGGSFVSASNIDVQDTTNVSKIGHLQFQMYSTEVAIQSTNRSNSLPMPLKLKTSSSDVSAVAFTGGFCVPQALQIGGTYGDFATGVSFSMNGSGTVLNISPGSSSTTVESHVAWNTDSTTGWHDLSSTKTVTMGVSGTTASMSAVNCPMTLLIGSGGAHDMTTVIGNSSSTSKVSYIPAATSGSLVVDSGTLADFQGELRTHGVITDSMSKGATSTLASDGWYFLGQLIVGRTTIDVAGQWTLEIDYDGSSYNTYYTVSNRNVVNVVIYQTSVDFYIFLRAQSTPCKVRVYESGGGVSLTTYEGPGGNPDGSTSGFNSATWTKVYDSADAAASTSQEFGGLKAAGVTVLSNSTISGMLHVTGQTAIAGNTTMIGSQFLWQQTQGGTPTTFASLTADVSLNSTLNLQSASGDVKAALQSGSNSASIEIPASGANANAVVISHETNSSASKIILATRNTDRVLVDDQGVFSVLSTIDSTDTQTAAAVIAGGCLVQKNLTVVGAIKSDQIALIGGTSQALLTASVDGHVSFNGVRAENLADPQNDGDAATKRYVDVTSQGLLPQSSVHVATVGANLDLTQPLLTLDGVILQNGDRVLVKDQTNATQNGVYVVQVSPASAPTRATDVSSGKRVSRFYFFVVSGVYNANSSWFCTASSAHDVVGTDLLTFSQINQAGDLEAGDGLLKVANQFNVDVDDYSLEIYANQLRIKHDSLGTGLTGGSGQPISVSSITHLSAVGTLTSGVWEATPISPQYGGTGATSFQANGVVFSDGTKLTQGLLTFDSSNNYLGVNTSSPTSGLTLQDRDLALIQSGSLPNHVILRDTNYSHALRMESNSLIFSGGTSSNPFSLTDNVSIDSLGVLNANRGANATYLTVDSSWKMTDIGMERIVTGPLSLGLFSADNSGATMSFYGAVGNVANVTNAEYLRVGYYNSNYVIQTAFAGTGTSHPLSIQAGNNTNQLLLNTDGSVSLTGPLTVQVTSDVLSSGNGGSVQLNGGALVGKSLYIGSTQDSLGSAGTSSGALMVRGGLSLGKSMTFATTGMQLSPVLTGGTSVLSVKAAQPALYVGTTSTISPVSSQIAMFTLGSGFASDYEALLIDDLDGSSTTFAIRARAAGSGNVRNISIGNSGQFLLKTDGTVVVGSTVVSSSPSTGSLLLSGGLSSICTSDATSVTSGGSVTLSGGLAVGKSAFIGGSLSAPQISVSSTLQFSQNGSADTVSMEYVSPGKLAFFGNTTTTLQIHAGNSTGPNTSDQEKLVIGYNDTTSYVIWSENTGLGALRDVVIQTGNNYNQFRVKTDNTAHFGCPVYFDSTLDSTSPTSGGSLTVQGGAAVAASLRVGGTSIVGAGSSSSVGAKYLTLNGSNPWSFKEGSSSSIVLSPDSANNKLIFANFGGSSLLTVDASNTEVSSSAPVVVNVNHAKAFNVQDGNGNDVFTVNTQSGYIDSNNYRIANVSMPIHATDIANKSYVDLVVQGLVPKDAVKAGSAVNVDITQAIASVDGVALTSGDRILLLSQTNAVENGIYVLGSGNMASRATDMAVGSHAAGAYTYINLGNTYAGLSYVCTSVSPNDVVGTNALTFSEFNSARLEAGDGLVKLNSYTLAVNLDTVGSALSFNSAKLRVDPSIAGSGLQMNSGVLSLTTITQVGTLTQGVWNATTIGLGYGGTGNTSFASGSVVFSNGSILTENNSNFFWDNSAQALGLGTTSPDVNAAGDGLCIATKDLCLRDDVDATSHQSILFANASGAYNWRIRRSDAGSGAAHLVFSSGSSTVKANLTDSAIMTSTGKLGLGYNIASVGSIANTLDVNGTLRVTGSVTLNTQLTVANGGTGATSLVGVVIGNSSSAMTSTGPLADGGVVIGNSSGAVIVESGATLRAHIGLAIGSDVQAHSANLDDISGISNASGNFIVGSGTHFVAQSGATARSSLGLGSLAVLNNINNSNWSGAQLTVGNGGTGSVSYTSGSFPYFDGTNLSSSTLLYDSLNSVIKSSVDVTVLSTTQSTSTSSGCLTTLGGVAIAKNLSVGGLVTVNGVAMNPSAGDISETSFSFANNQLVAANVTGLSFSNSAVRSFKAYVSVTIIVSSGSNLYEFFEINAVQRTSDWQYVISSIGDSSGVIFSVTTAGAVQYTSTNVSNFTSGTMKFRAITTSV